MITIGLVVIGIILMAIMGAFIVSPGFRKDVIASEGEAAVFGLINVKGVIIVLLTAIFVGAFVYIIKINNQSKTELSQSDAIGYLKNDKEVSYSVTTNSSEKGFALKANGTIIGNLNIDLNKNLDAVKTNVKDWLVTLGDIKLGTVSMNVEQERHFWHKGQNPLYYEQKKPYRVGNLDFFFRIDSIYHLKLDSVSIPYYDFSFGEGEQVDDIKWRKDKVNYSKTDNGKIDLNNGLKHLYDSKWDCNYYVGVGVGLPGGSKPHVEMLNIMVIQAKLE